MILFDWVFENLFNFLTNFPKFEFRVKSFWTWNNFEFYGGSLKYLKICSLSLYKGYFKLIRLIWYVKLHGKRCQIRNILSLLYPMSVYAIHVPEIMWNFWKSDLSWFNTSHNFKRYVTEIRKPSCQLHHNEFSSDTWGWAFKPLVI